MAMRHRPRLSRPRWSCRCPCFRSRVGRTAGAVARMAGGSRNATARRRASGARCAANSGRPAGRRGGPALPPEPEPPSLRLTRRRLPSRPAISTRPSVRSGPGPARRPARCRACPKSSPRPARSRCPRPGPCQAWAAAETNASVFTASSEDPELTQRQRAHRRHHPIRPTQIDGADSSARARTA